MADYTTEIHYLMRLDARAADGDFAGAIEVAGLYYRRDAFRAALKGKHIQLYLKRNPTNKHDRNAIKVMLKCRRFGLPRRYHVGFVPAELAARITHPKTFQHVLVTPAEAWIGDRGGAGFSIYFYA